MRNFITLWDLRMFVFCATIISAFASASQEFGSVRIKELCRVSSSKENSLIGYGLVTGLAGTGDSIRSTSTMQSIKNTLRRFDVNVPLEDTRSRNVAAVMVTTSLPPYSQIGNKLDVNVTSLGDARSLVGGTLLLAHLIGADNKIYALAQGPISVGGYSYDLNGNIAQKNHATSAQIVGGAIVERQVNAPLVDENGHLEFILNEPNFDTADKIARSLGAWLGVNNVWAVDAARIKVTLSAEQQRHVVSMISKIEESSIEPNSLSRVVINERTGTVIAGGLVKISPVTITHGDLNVAITTDYSVSQPNRVWTRGGQISTKVVPHTDIKIDEETGNLVALPHYSTVAELVSALNKVHASTRDIITILQGIKRAGALHAELIIQ